VAGRALSPFVGRTSERYALSAMRSKLRHATCTVELDAGRCAGFLRVEAQLWFGIRAEALRHPHAQSSPRCADCDSYCPFSSGRLGSILDVLEVVRAASSSPISHLHSMKLFIALLTACTCIANASAQSVPAAISGYELISIYAPVRSSVAEAPGLFTPLGTRYTGVHPSFAAGDWIELDLRRDADGQPARVAYVCAYADQTASNPGEQIFDLFAKATDTAPFQPAGELLVSPLESPYGPRFFSLHFPAVSLRLVARSAPSETFNIFWLGVATLDYQRPQMRIVQHSWYLGAPAPGAPAGVSFTLPVSGQFGILFGAPGPALLSQAIRLGLPGHGGLVLDPAVAQLLRVEPFIGGGWREDIYFPFDPILLSTQVHFQSATMRLDPVLGNVVTWTPPITF
jgi:hypothetical protein